MKQNLTTEQKAAIFDRLCQSIYDNIEGGIPGWLDANPYFEVDDEDMNGNRTFRYPPTSDNDAREALQEALLDEADTIGLYDLVEIALNQVYNTPIREDNALLHQEPSIMQEIIQQYINLPEMLAKAGAL